MYVNNKNERIENNEKCPFLILLLCAYYVKCNFSFQSVVLKLLVFKNLLKLRRTDSHTILVKVDSGYLGSRPWNNFLTNSLGDPELSGFQSSCLICHILILHLFPEANNNSGATKTLALLRINSQVFWNYYYVQSWVIFVVLTMTLYHWGGKLLWSLIIYQLVLFSCAWISRLTFFISPHKYYLGNIIINDMWIVLK